MLTKSMTSSKPHTQLKLSKGKFALVDPWLFDELDKFYWRAVKSNVKWYAVRRYWNGSKFVNVYMHRQISKTPANMQCHHVNGNSLDNRVINLLNLSRLDHMALHAHQRISR